MSNSGEEEASAKASSVMDSKVANKRKLTTIVIAAILLIVAVGSGVYVTFIQDGGSHGGPADETAPKTYVGALIPSHYLESGVPAVVFSDMRASQGVYFVGYDKNDSSRQLKIVEITSSLTIPEMIGGEFSLNSTSSDKLFLQRVISSSPESIDVGSLGSAMDSLFKSVVVDFASLSIVFGNYTLGIGTSVDEDYLWIAPKKSYPTFLNDVSVTGIVFNESVLLELSDMFTDSVFGETDIEKLGSLTESFSFDFVGTSTDFLIVTNLTYKNVVSIECDVIDTIVPSDVDRLASAFSTGGTEWLKQVTANIGEGIAVAVESDLSISDTKLWFMLYSLTDFNSFPGISQIQVSESDLSVVTEKISSLLPTSFNLNLGFNFEVSLGVIVAATEPEYTSSSITAVWQSVSASHPKTLVMNADIEGYGIVVDLETLLTSLSDAFGVSSGDIDAVNTLTTFKNPAFVLLLDEKIPEMLSSTGSPAWEYAVLAIIPDYAATESGFRYLDLKGVVYDPAAYFGSSSPLCHIPIVVADNYTEVMEGLQHATVKDLCTGSVTLNEFGWGYVEVESMTMGTTLKTVFGEVSSVDPLSALIQTAVTAFPLDLCIYEGFKIDGLTEIYHVPIIHVATVQGPTYYGLNVTNVRGMYISFSASLSQFESFLQAHIDEYLGAPGVNSSLLYDIANLLFGTDISNATSQVTDFVHSLMGSGIVPAGFILAFSLEEIANTPPSVSIVTPAEGSVVYLDDFNITLNIQDDPDLALWVEIRILNDGQNIFLFDVPMPFPVLKNGVWSTGEGITGWFWGVMKEYMEAISISENVRIYVRVHDLRGYSLELQRDFTILGVSPDFALPTSYVQEQPQYQNAEVFSVVATAYDSRGIDGVELWYNRGGEWLFYENDTFSFPEWSWSFDASLTGGDGLYQFYSRAVDTSGNYELPPPSSDTYTFVDTVAPTATAVGPSSSGTLTFNLSYSIADSSSSSGIDTVQLYGRKSSEWLWTDYGLDPDHTSPMQVTVTEDATYEWCFFAADNAGNAEDVPIFKAAELTTVVLSDAVKPQSWVTALPPYENSNMVSLFLGSFDVSAEAHDNVEVNAVELWYNYGSGWLFYGNDTYVGDGWTWSVNTILLPDGYYYFYSRAIDASGNYEDAPLVADNWTFVERYAPSATAIGPSTSTTYTFDITFYVDDPAPSSGVARITLWYTTNSGLTWSEAGDDSDTSSPMTVTVPSAGSYGWIFVAEDNAGNAEASPSILQLAEWTTEVVPDSGGSFGTATNLTGISSWSEFLNVTPGDQDDYFMIWLNVGDSLTVQLDGPLFLADFDLYLYDPLLNMVDSSYEIGSYETVSISSVTVAGCYYVDVNAWDGNGSYTLTVTIS
ncbi:MAG TPA: PPC domain-containing protein [Thermoplasmata archaeon]|jgi:hypothetical protein